MSKMLYSKKSPDMYSVFLVTFVCIIAPYMMGYAMSLLVHTLYAFMGAYMGTLLTYRRKSTTMSRFKRALKYTPKSKEIALNNNILFGGVAGFLMSSIMLPYTLFNYKLIGDIHHRLTHDIKIFAYKYMDEASGPNPGAGSSSDSGSDSDSSSDSS